MSDTAAASTSATTSLSKDKKASKPKKNLVKFKGIFYDTEDPVAREALRDQRSKAQGWIGWFPAASATPKPPKAASATPKAAPTSQPNVKKENEIKKTSKPPCKVMIVAAIKALKASNGSSLAAIKKYINTNYEVDMVKRAPFIRRGLKTLVDENVLTQVKGSYKIAKVKKPKKDNKSGIWRIVEPFPEESGPYPYWENPPWNFQDDAEKGQGSSGSFKSTMKVEKKKPKKKVDKKKNKPKEKSLESQDNTEHDPLQFDDPLDTSKIQKSREIALAPIFIKEEPIDIDSVTIKTEVDDDENFGSTNTNEFQFVDTNLKIEKEI